MSCYYAIPDDIIDIIYKMAHQMSYHEALEDIVSGKGQDLRITVGWQPIFTTLV
jgi:hypothetical protein